MAQAPAQTAVLARASRRPRQADVLRARALVLAPRVALAYHDLVQTLDEAVARRGQPVTRPDLARASRRQPTCCCVAARSGDTVVRADAVAAAVLAAAGAEVAAHLVEVNLLSLEAHERSDRVRQLAAAAGASRAGALAVR